jgi:hypothetical protein
MWYSRNSSAPCCTPAAASDWLWSDSTLQQAVMDQTVMKGVWSAGLDLEG